MRVPALPRLFAVAAVAASLSACGGDDDDLPEVAAPTSPKLELDGGEFYFEPESIAVAEGSVDVVLHNIGKVVHDIRVDGIPELIVEARPGLTGTATWRLDAGRYALYCSIPGHRQAGMVGVLEVRGE